MIIHVCQLRLENDDVVRQAIRIIHDLGHSTSAEGSLEPLEDTVKEKVRAAAKSIERSEMVIAECSGDSTFNVGYEVALALQSRKPTILLVREGSEADSYAIGLESDFVALRSYTKQTLDKIVRDFIKENEVQTKDLRFNFVIDRKIYNHLRLKSFKSGKTKAEVVRDLLNKDLESGEE